MLAALFLVTMLRMDMLKYFWLYEISSKRLERSRSLIENTNGINTLFYAYTHKGRYVIFVYLLSTANGA